MTHSDALKIVHELRIINVSLVIICVWLVIMAIVMLMKP